MQVTLQYYGSLEAERGLFEETKQVTSPLTARKLYQNVTREHGLTLPGNALRVAVNHAFADWEILLQEGDTVAFMPPFAGG